ncbi:MAG: hypothetical protein AAGI25_12060 [Bacteroidota bacterium]
MIFTSLIAVDILTEAAFISKEKAETELRYLSEELFDINIIYPGEDYSSKVLFKRMGE